MRGETIHQQISRTVKYISVISCASAAGESLIPCISQSQDSFSVREKLKKHSLRFGTDLTMKSSAKPWINVAMLLDYIQTVFLPNRVESSGLNGFDEEIALLLMDNCPSQIRCLVI
jgi:hypothetical protein